MALTLKGIYTLDKNKFDLTLHAGENGLSNILTWVYLMEDIYNTDFLRGNELIITTGIQISDERQLLFFIQTLQQCHCSGLILNVGKYILPNSLSEDIINFCNQTDFPLFTMPWNIYISDVMQDFCLKLTRQMQQEKILALSFERALNSPQYQESYLPALMQEGYSLCDEYRILTLESADTNLNIQTITAAFSDIYCFSYHQFYVLILREKSAITPDIFLTDFLTYISSKDVSFHLGTGALVHSLTNLRDSFLQSIFCLSVSKNTENNTVIFDQLGVYKLLYKISDIDFLKQFVEECLGVILQYDSAHHADYIETLHIYLLHDCSIKKTANIMITHRNTINYRIHKIRELLHMDFESQENKFQLLLAFYIREYLHYIEDIVS